jgi:Cys-rich protein (TIGR01571 family)
VQEGASFRARIIIEPEDPPLKTDDIPSGAWKDGIFGCRTHPLCHPSLCLSIFCCSIALGQIMTRLHLDWKGAHIGRRPVGWTPFKIMMLATIAFVVWDNVLSIIVLPYVSSTEQVVPKWAIMLIGFRGLVRCLFLAYFMFAMFRTRAYIRNTYSIRKQRLSGYYDCCLSVLFPCCSIAQMARHTVNYRQSTAACCSETGIAAHKSSLVEPSMV